MAIPRGNASIICGASYHVWDLPSVIICDDVAKDPSDRLSLLTSAKSYISELRYLARYFPANIPWPMTDLILLDSIDTSINLADHLTKILSRILFHRHADYLLGHIPQKYSPVYQRAISTFSKSYKGEIDQFVPSSFTTPFTAKAARIFTPKHNDIKGNPWLSILWHECTIQNYVMDCGGVLVYT